MHYELTECVQDGVHPGVHRWLDTGPRLLQDPLISGAGLRPDTASTVMALYLIDLATRYLHDRQAAERSAQIDRLADLAAQMRP